MNGVTPIPVPQDANQFRCMTSPYFDDPLIYPDNAIELWLWVGSLLLTCRWGNLLGVGILLFVEHNLYMGAQGVAGLNGGSSGAVRGPIVSEAAGSVSVSYDMSAVLNPEAGWWNYSKYGQRFFWLLRMVGAGPIQLNVPPWAGVCACGGAWNPGALVAAGLAGRVGPGWFDMKNVPISKFLPQSTRAPMV